MDETNVKLMALVPMNMTHNLQQQQVHSESGNQSIPALHTNPELLRLKSLEENLLSVLNETVLDPEIKMGKYIELLNKHSNVMKSVNKPFRIDIKGTINKKRGSVGEDVDLDAEQQEEIPDLQAIMETLSKRNKQKADVFLSHLEKIPWLTWDRENAVSIRGKRIKNSNIWKIFKDFFSNRKRTSPGFSSVAYELMDAKVPKNSFINRAAFDTLQKSRNKPRFRKKVRRKDGFKRSKESSDDEYEENIGSDLAFSNYTESDWP